jgi:hypothetical protein
MTDPVIIAAAALLLMPSLAPNIHVPPLHAFTVPQAVAAYATLCQSDYRIIREAEATTVPRADPHALVRARQANGNRLTIAPRPTPAPRHHRHRHHHRR